MKPRRKRTKIVNAVPKLSFSMDELCRSTGFARSRLYADMARGVLKTFKAGKRRFATADAAADYLATLQRGGRLSAWGEK